MSVVARAESPPRAWDEVAAVRAAVPMPRLDQVSLVAARALRAPVAHVSLVGPEDQVLLGASGLRDPLDTTRVLPLTHSLCKAVVASGEPLAVRDLRRDPELCSNGAVVDHGVVAYAGVPVRSESGAVLGAFCVLDMRPRRWSAEQLEVLSATASLVESEIALQVADRDRRQAWRQLEYFHRAIQQVSDVVWSLDITGGHAELVYASPNSHRVFGGQVSVDGDLLDTLVGMVHVDDRPVIEQFNQRLLEGEPADTEVRIVGVDRRLRWVWIRAVPRWEDGRLFADGVTSDVSERHRLDDLRNQFLAIAGHELRTPLTVIRGYAELLVDLVKHDPVAAGQAGAIERRAGELGALINDFFDLARFQSGALRLDRGIVDVDQLLVEVVGDHDGAARRRGVAMELATEPAALMGDAVRLRQVVDNLVTNAVKYTPGGGRVRVLCVRHDDTVEIRVEDSGIGVSEEDLPLLFERFYRTDNGRQQSLEGTGLGLAVVKALVELHGGTVTAAVRPGGGMVFAVVLPTTVDDVA